jgi:chemotaxis protein MotB
VKQHRTPERKSDPDRWIISYADFVTLLFAVFTMLYAVSVVDAKRAEQLVNAIQTAFRPGGGEAAIALPAPAGEIAQPADAELIALRERIERTAAELELQDGITVYDSPEGLVLRLADAFFFEAGGDTLGSASRRAIERIARLLASTTNHLRIEGHSDDRPIASPRFASNWHLSVARAASIALALTESGIPGHRIGAMGYGAERPLVSNETEAGRAINRRVDVVILREP